MKDITNKQVKCPKCKTPLVWVSSYLKDGNCIKDDGFLSIVLPDTNIFRCPKCFRYFEEKNR
jgi:hypothetical protein